MFYKVSTCKLFDVSITFISSNFHCYFVVAPAYYRDEILCTRLSYVKFIGILDVYNSLL